MKKLINQNTENFDNGLQKYKSTTSIGLFGLLTLASCSQTDNKTINEKVVKETISSDTISLLEGTSSGFIAQDNTSNTISLSDATKKYSTTEQEKDKLEKQMVIDKKISEAINKLNKAIEEYSKDPKSEELLLDADDVYGETKIIIDKYAKKDSDIYKSFSKIEKSLQDITLAFNTTEDENIKLALIKIKNDNNALRAENLLLDKEIEKLKNEVIIAEKK